MSWRPEGWDKIYQEAVDKMADPYVSKGVFEWGADAMLEALKAIGYERESDRDFAEWQQAHKETWRWLIWLPDEEEK